MNETYLYSVRTEIGRYRVVKFDFLINVERIYYVKEYHGRLSCDCFQSRAPICRHREMIGLFSLLGRIDRGYFYCYDTKTWMLPVSDRFNQLRKRRKQWRSKL